VINHTQHIPGFDKVCYMAKHLLALRREARPHSLAFLLN
jgi:hypothetical protein